MSGRGAGRVSVAVIGGGRNDEHDISVASADGIAGALGPDRYRVTRLDLGRHGGWTAGGAELHVAEAMAMLVASDVVIPTVHGVGGEDGALAGLCESLGVAYVGSGVRAGAIGMDKQLTKTVAAAAGIAVAEAAVLAPDDSLPAWTGPVVVKPNDGGSSNGVLAVHDPALLADAVRDARLHSSRVLVERLVVGREIDLAVVGSPDGARSVSPAIEIVCDGVFDREAKYGGGADFRIPAALSDDEAEALQRAAIAVYDAVGCAGVARVDFFLTADGPVLNEINTAPGMTARSQVPLAFAAAGMPFSALLDRLVGDALAASAVPV